MSELEHDPGGAFAIAPALRTLLDALPDALVVVDAAGTILEANHQAERLFGYEDRELVGQVVEVLVPDAVRDQHALQRRRSMKAHRPRPMGSGVSLAARRKDGSTFPADVSLSFLDSPGGPVAIAAVRDLTERNAVLEALARHAAGLAHAQEELRLSRLLRASQEQLQAVVANLPIVLFTTNDAGELDLVTGKGLEAVGLQPHDLIGRPLADLFPDAPHAAANIQRALAGESTRVAVTVAGAWFDLWLSPKRCENGELAGIHGVMGVANEVTEHKRLEAELTAARQELEARVLERTKALTAALEALKQKEFRLAEAERIARLGHWDFDLLNDRILWSDGACQVFGFTHAAAPSSLDAFLAGLHHDDRPIVVAAIRVALDGPAPYAAEYRYRRADGTVVGIQARGEVTRDRDGRPLRMLGTVLDVSERKAIEEELVRRRAEVLQARETQRLKDSLVNAYVHDLRSPLTGIIGYAELLADGLAGPITEAQLTLLNRVLDIARRQARLINDMLDLARYEAGTFRLQREPTDLGEKIGEIVAEMASQAQEAGVVILTELPATPVTASVDGQRIGQVLVNLLHNAIKCSRRGQTVRVRMESANDQVRIEVVDQGVGIAKEEIPALFKQFSQASAGREHHAGTGLGLWICKTIVEAHGGAIEVASEPGRGSTFSFTLPA